MPYPSSSTIVPSGACNWRPATEISGWKTQPEIHTTPRKVMTSSTDQRSRGVEIDLSPVTFRFYQVKIVLRSRGRAVECGGFETLGFQLPDSPWPPIS